jgi:thiol-disulfide isomerase/thioredoxin
MFRNKSIIITSLIIGLSLVLSACSLTTSPSNLDEADDNKEAKATIYFFWGDGCPHCATQKVFLDKMENKYPDLEIKSFETWKNPENAQIFQDMAQAYNIRAAGVPTTFIGDFEPTVGFTNKMSDSMEEKIVFCLEEGCPNPGDKISN